MNTPTIDAIDKAIELAHNEGVRITAGRGIADDSSAAHLIAGALCSAAEEEAANNPDTVVTSVEIELGAEGYRAWYLSIDSITMDVDDEGFHTATLPDAGTTVRLTEGGRGGRGWQFTAN